MVKKQMKNLHLLTICKQSSSCEKKEPTAIYKIKIKLMESRPAIWRTLLVPSSILLPDLHKVIQTSMGWTNSHLHHFMKHGEIFCLPSEDDFGMPVVDYSEIRLNELLTREKETMTYEYDFGDSWVHEITLQKILPFDKKEKVPTCLDGKQACPPEDCGGVWGYADLLKTLKDPSCKGYEEMREWVGEEFDPEYFDISSVNDALRTKYYGCDCFF